MFVVLGATGNTGSVAASTLLAQGKSVRVVVHNAAKGEAWKAKGADVAVADVLLHGELGPCATARRAGHFSNLPARGPSNPDGCHARRRRCGGAAACRGRKRRANR